MRRGAAPPADGPSPLKTDIYPSPVRMNETRGLSDQGWRQPFRSPPLTSAMHR